MSTPSANSLAMMGTRPDSPSAKAFRGHIHGPPTFTSKTEEREFVKFRLAQALRIFGNRGFDEGPAGHITVRDPIRTDCFWVNPFGLHFKLIQPADLLLVSHSGEIQDAETGHASLWGTRFRVLNTAAFMIHSAIHGARPDVLCAAHSHSPYGKAFSALGKTLDPISQDACAFYGDHALYTQYNGIVLDEQEGAAIVEALGNKKAAILQNHGLLVGTASIEGTVAFYIALERACQVQLLADTAAAADGGKTVKINPEQAAETARIVGTQGAGWFSGSMEFMVLEAEERVTFQFAENK
ncbi:Aldolase-II domain-containing protein [Mycena indigotica]|uniref:Aldolase-II domain-containing protein n=1 Tax=Mycena indigotica TaxID=2126181 RepID=A0A8H6RZM3_9AGAR|nr:Aldolase-II domain-containing protein [Mycena indigotica]KAF7289182.1 Aldolase-II domain-containing protein [Mycena indigotica]